MEILKSISLVSIIGFILAFFNKENDKYNKYLEMYFDDFLVEFYKLYKTDKNMKTDKFIAENNIYSKAYIPAYISYLKEQERYEDIEKVLIIDYYNYFPNKSNSFMQAYEHFANAIEFLYFTFLLMFGGLLILLVLISLGLINQPNGVENLGKYIAYLFTFLILIRFVIAFIASDDVYTHKEKYIKKHIVKRLIGYSNLDKSLIQKILSNFKNTIELKIQVLIKIGFSFTMKIRTCYLVIKGQSNRFFIKILKK